LEKIVLYRLRFISTAEHYHMHKGKNKESLMGKSKGEKLELCLK